MLPRRQRVQEHDPAVRETQTLPGPCRRRDEDVRAWLYGARLDARRAQAVQPCGRGPSRRIRHPRCRRGLRTALAAGAATQSVSSHAREQHVKLPGGSERALAPTRT